MPLSIQIFHQHPAAGRVVVKDGQGIRQLLIVAVYENQRDALCHQLLIEPDVRVGETRLRSLHQHTVELFHLQQLQQDPAFVSELVLRCEQQRGAVVLRTDGLNLPQDAGEDIIADIGRHHRDRAMGPRHAFPLLKDVGAAALSALDELLGLQKGKRLTHRLSAHLKLLAQRQLRRQGLLVRPVQDPFPERFGHDLIFRIHMRAPFLGSNRACPFRTSTHNKC